MFIISEISPQFSGDIQKAKRMIFESYTNGASLVKFQLYPSNMFSIDGLDRSYNELTFDKFKELFEFGKKVGIDIFATAFTPERLEWCKTLKVKYHKIASRMHDEFPDLVDQILSENTKTFVSISDKNIDLVKKFKDRDKYTVLYCVSSYPTLLSDAKIPEFSNYTFQGISDHTLGIGYALKACSLGAKFLEKHFSLNKNLQRHTEKGHLGAMDSKDLNLLKNLTDEIDLIGVEEKKI